MSDEAQGDGVSEAVHKVFRTTHVEYVACGHPWMRGKRSYKWEFVTCKRCLSRRSKIK